jgi:hypothetical protein
MRKLFEDGSLLPNGTRVMYKKLLAERVPAKFKELGFQPVTTARKKSLPRRWFRDRGTIFDIVAFDWDTYDPSLIVDFRSFDHPDDLYQCRNDLKSVNEWDFGLRAYMKPKYSGWFKPSLISCWLNQQREMSRVVDALLVSLVDVDHVMQGGTPSTPMKDKDSWCDPRLPDSPPPWGEPGGKRISNYHLPPYRVGKGNKCATWEL